MVAGQKCKLRLFTWVCIESEGRKEVAPTCPDHGLAEVRSRPFGDGFLFICLAGMDHVLNHCSRQEFEAEKQEAEARLCTDRASDAAHC